MALTPLSLSTASPFSSSLRASNGLVRCSLTAPMAVSMSRSSSPSNFFSSVKFSLVSSFSGSSLGGLSIAPNKSKSGTERNRPLIVVAGKKYSLGQTKRNRSRKSLARVHGFRIRMRTPGGRKVLKRRRDKGRKQLCPKTHPSSGKRHMGYGRRSRRRR